MQYEVSIALRYLRARRKQAFISLITLLSMAGVALGVCALIVVLSVMSGFETELKRKILGQSSHVLLFKAGEAMDRPAWVVKKAQADQEVAAAAPFVLGQAMVVAQGAASGAIMRGIALPASLKVSDIKDSLVRGSLEDLVRSKRDGLPGVVLGSALARRLGARMDEVVNLVNPLGEETPVGRIPKSEPFVVVGIFESGMYQYDSSLIYVSLPAAQEFFGLGSDVSGVELKVKDVYSADKVGLRVANALGPAYYARDWMRSNHSLFSALKLEKFTMFVILILIVLVAAFGIVSSLIMVVMEKGKDIAILKTMGATSKSIRRIFTLEGLVIGLCGTVLGLAAGLSLCALLDRYQFIHLPADVYPLSTLPVQVEPQMVALVGVCAVALCLVATLYPSWAAGRLDPVEALRYE